MSEGIWPGSTYITDPKRPYVTSNVPFIEPRWWDHPALHLIFSYSSWIGVILASGYGRPGWQRIHNRIFKR